MDNICCKQSHDDNNMYTTGNNNHIDGRNAKCCLTLGLKYLKISFKGFKKSSFSVQVKFSEEE